jgi:hypothetical protein
VSAPKLDLARLRSLHPTVAPWGVAAGGHRVVAVDEHGKERGGLRVGHFPHIANVARPDDAELMAAAPALLAEVERLRGLVAEVGHCLEIAMERWDVAARTDEEEYNDRGMCEIALQRAKETR